MIVDQCSKLTTRSCPAKGLRIPLLRSRGQHTDSIYISDRGGIYCAFKKQVYASDRETATALTAAGITTGVTM
eukprot:5121545-Lingulodinium_polyedra.AAC.1